MVTRPDEELELETELESEWESDFESELETEPESDYEEEMEEELESDAELEYETDFEGELEGEEFFKKIGRLFRRALPFIRRLAPIVSKAVGGPLGGILSRFLRESEYEYELEGELEEATDGEFEVEVTTPLTQQQAESELMAAVASQAQTDDEAEAMVGAATFSTLTPGDRAALRSIIPCLVRGTAILTRILRRRYVTRPIIRTVPTIVRCTARSIRKRIGAGRPVNRRLAGRIMAAQVNRVLRSPAASMKAIKRNVVATRAAARSSRLRLRKRPITV